MVKKRSQSGLPGRRHSREIDIFQNRFFESSDWTKTHKPTFFKRLKADFKRQGIKEADIKELMFQLTDGLTDLLMLVYAVRHPTGLGPAVRKKIINGVLFHATNHLATAAFILSDGINPILHLETHHAARIKYETASSGWR